MSLSKIQVELKASKSQYNSFGGYKYRALEDITEAIKPLLEKYKASLTMSDDIVVVGDRFYVKATVTLKVGDEEHTTTAFAREPLEKKKMDDSQVTGMASSYARKYALNGLLAIDDTKDADSMDNSDKEEAKHKLPTASKATDADKKKLWSDFVETCNKYEVDAKEFLEWCGVKMDKPSDIHNAVVKFLSIGQDFDNQVLTYKHREN